MHFLNISSRDWIDLVVSFKTSPSSSKSEFGCKSYRVFRRSFFPVSCGSGSTGPGTGPGTGCPVQPGLEPDLGPDVRYMARSTGYFTGRCPVAFWTPSGRQSGPPDQGPDVRSEVRFDRMLDRTSRRIPPTAGFSS